MNNDQSLFSIQSRWSVCTLFILFMLPQMVRSQVASHDITLQPPVTDNLPVITAITAYNSTEAAASAANAQAPLYAPYNACVNNFQDNDPWWDNLVSEQIQARLPVVMLSAEGCYSTNPTDMTGPGNMNPRLLTNYTAALQRAGGSNVIKFGCFAEAAAQTIYRNYYNLPPGTLVDFSNQDSWNQVWWLRVIKPWFDSVPSSQWYKINGAVPVEFWGLNINTIYTNQQGNISQLFNYLAAQMQVTYGVSPCFIMGSPGCDTTLGSCAYYVGDNEWFGPPSNPYTMTSYKGNVWGGLVAGYINPNYYVQGNSVYQDPNAVVVRTGFSNRGVAGANGDTLIDGLAAAIASNSYFNIIEGYTDISESCGLYRSNNAAWSYPNQNLNIIASYSDLRTVTQRLTAAGCDANNATTGNLGGSFLRAGNGGGLSVRALTGAPVISSSSQNTPYHYDYQAFDGTLYTEWVSQSAAPGWLQYNFGSGNSAVVTGYYVTNSTYAQGYDPSAWQFQGSNDGVNWTTLDTETSQTFAARNQTNSYSFTNSTSYEFYRLSITANYGGSGYPIALAELKFIIGASNGGGWAVTNTTSGEYLQWDSVNFSAGNYNFPLCYSSTAAHTVTLSVDSNVIATTVLPSSGGMNTFTTAYIGAGPIAAGPHNLTLTFVDGGPDVQWLFVKKYDPLVTFLAKVNNSYVTAALGGNEAGMTATDATAGSWQSFSLDDLQSNYGMIEAASYNSFSGNENVQASSEGGTCVGRIDNGTYLVFNQVDLNGITSFAARTTGANSGAAGQINIHLDSPTGTLIGTCLAPYTGGWQTWTTQTCDLSGASGYHNIYLVFTGNGSGLCNFEWFAFHGANNGTEAASFNGESGGITTETCSEGGQDDTNIVNGSYAVYNNVNLNGATSFTARVASATSGGNIQIRLDSSTGTLIGTCAVPGTAGGQAWTTVSCNIGGASGYHNLYLVNTGGSGNLFNVEWFTLQGADNLIYTGDRVNFQCWDGLYLTSENNGGGVLSDNRRAPGSSENFTLIKLNGGSTAVQNGDQIVLKSSGGNNYVTVESNGTVDVTGTSVGTAQTFTVGLSTQ